MNEWNIQSRAHTCQACERPFADQEAYHTLLFDLKSEFMRQDICLSCWQAQYSQGAQDRKGFVSHWQGVYEAPAPAPPDPILRETAESLLRKLTGLNDPKYAPAAYILAAMLERKRVLKVKEQVHREDQRIFIYEQPKTGDMFTIPDPKLQLNQLDEVQRDVAALLEHGPPQPAAIAASAPESSLTGENPPTSSDAEASQAATGPPPTEGNVLAEPAASAVASDSASVSPAQPNATS
jgi:hypothetical protein